MSDSPPATRSERRRHGKSWARRLNTSEGLLARLGPLAVLPPAPAPSPHQFGDYLRDGRRWTAANYTRALSASGPPVHHRPLGNALPIALPSHDHQSLPGCCAVRSGVAAGPQWRTQGRPRSSGRTPRLLSPRKLARSVHQPRRRGRGRDDQRDPYVGRPSGHPRGPGPCAAHPVGCGLMCVPRWSLLPERRRSRGGSHTLHRCAARPIPVDRSVRPVRTRSREVTNV